jgi:dipeptidyl aminopeptidase/acylaminoacyl peptidase
MHGDKDTLVPLAQSEMLVDALKKAGVDVHLETYEGAGHGGPAFFSPTARGMMLQFFNKHLKPAKTAAK